MDKQIANKWGWRGEGVSCLPCLRVGIWGTVKVPSYIEEDGDMIYASRKTANDALT
jgi:hypothetical protein